ncbi:hypothetical protein [Notoacmeibacter marinus]|uniref:hypothetical protein n=1 Tax=Notoacmeibacter marinus TaxID=1876515 RepID=UPI000DF3B7E3|nr:hypothetical protein [Notoacmeibacter marinus]
MTTPFSSAKGAAPILCQHLGRPGQQVRDVLVRYQRDDAGRLSGGFLALENAPRGHDHRFEVARLVSMIGVTLVEETFGERASMFFQFREYGIVMKTLQ